MRQSMSSLLPAPASHAGVLNLLYLRDSPPESDGGSSEGTDFTVGVSPPAVAFLHQLGDIGLNIVSVFGGMATVHIILVLS